MPTTNYYTVNGRIFGEEQVGGPGFRAYGTDAIGSVIATYDSSGKLENTYRYSPLGAIVQSNEPAPAPAFQWNGGWGYRVTGRSYAEYYVRARHYSNRLASWTTVDPLWPNQAPYSYVSGNPLTKIDSSGADQFVLQGQSYNKRGNFLFGLAGTFQLPAFCDLPDPQAANPYIDLYVSITVGGSSVLDAGLSYGYQHTGRHGGPCPGHGPCWGMFIHKDGYAPDSYNLPLLFAGSAVDYNFWADPGGTVHFDCCGHSLSQYQGPGPYGMAITIGSEFFGHANSFTYTSLSVTGVYLQPSVNGRGVSSAQIGMFHPFTTNPNVQGQLPNLGNWPLASSLGNPFKPCGNPLIWPESRALGPGLKEGLATA